MALPPHIGQRGLIFPAQRQRHAPAERRGVEDAFAWYWIRRERGDSKDQLPGAIDSV
jgi:hypothetical protein